MGKNKNNKSNVPAKTKKTSGGGGGRKGSPVDLLMHKSALTGAGIGAATSVALNLAVSKYGNKLPDFMKNEYAQLGIMAAAPAFIAGYIVKDKQAALVAAGVGLAFGMASIATKMINKSSQGAPAANGVAGAIGMSEDVYERGVSGASDDFLSGIDEEQIQGVVYVDANGEQRFRAAPGVEGVETDNGSISGDDDQVSFSGELSGFDGWIGSADKIA
jgi:hypothetical protein